MAASSQAGQGETRTPTSISGVPPDLCRDNAHVSSEKLLPISWGAGVLWFCSLTKSEAPPTCHPHGSRYDTCETTVQMSRYVLVVERPTYDYFIGRSHTLLWSQDAAAFWSWDRWRSILTLLDKKILGRRDCLPMWLPLVQIKELLFCSCSTPKPRSHFFIYYSSWLTISLHEIL